MREQSREARLRKLQENEEGSPPREADPEDQSQEREEETLKESNVPSTPTAGEVRREDQKIATQVERETKEDQKIEPREIQEALAPEDSKPDQTEEPIPPVTSSIIVMTSSTDAL